MATTATYLQKSQDEATSEIVDSKSFGNLSKTVPLSILATGIAASLVVAMIRGLDYDGLLTAGLTLVSFAVAGGVGSLTAWQGKSQTQIDLQAARTVTPEKQAPVANIQPNLAEINAAPAKAEKTEETPAKSEPSSVPADQAVTNPGFYETPATTDNPDIKL